MLSLLFRKGRKVFKRRFKSKKSAARAVRGLRSVGVKRVRKRRY